MLVSGICLLSFLVFATCELRLRAQHNMGAQNDKNALRFDLFLSSKGKTQGSWNKKCDHVYNRMKLILYYIRYNLKSSVRHYQRHHVFLCFCWSHPNQKPKVHRYQFRNDNNEGYLCIGCLQILNFFSI